MGQVLAEGALIDVAWLLAAIILIFAAGATALKRYDVR